MKYQIFVRTWWAKDPKTKQRIPKIGRKSQIDYVNTIEEARERCKQYNENNDPGIYSRKMEFTSDF